jgi:hypothetical protein
MPVGRAGEHLTELLAKKSRASQKFTATTAR